MDAELFVAATEFAHDGTNERFCVAEEHEGLVEIVERVFNACETGAHTAFDHHHSARLVHVKNGHAKNGARCVGARGWIGHVVRTNHQGHVGLGKVSVDFIHVQELVVRNVRFSEQDVHVAGHAAGDGMNPKFYVDAALRQRVV